MRRGSVELDGEQFDKEGPQLLCRRRRLDRGRVDGQSRVKFRSKLAWSNEHPQASSLQSNRKHTRPSICIMVDFSIPPLTYSTAIPALLRPLSRQSAGPITQKYASGGARVRALVRAVPCRSLLGIRSMKVQGTRLLHGQLVTIENAFASALDSPLSTSSSRA